MQKWFVDRFWYVWPPLIIVIALVAWVLSGMAGHGAWKFTLAFVSVLVGAAFYHVIHQKFGSKLTMLPALEKTMVVIALMIPLFCWFFWALKPTWYAEWRNSTFYPLMITAMFFLGWLSSLPNNPAVNYSRLALLILCGLAVTLGAYRISPAAPMVDRWLASDSPKAIAVAEQQQMIAAHREHLKLFPESTFVFVTDTTFERIGTPSGSLRTYLPLGMRWGLTPLDYMNYGVKYPTDHGDTTVIFQKTDTHHDLPYPIRWIEIVAVDGPTAPVSIRIHRVQ